MAVLKTSRYAGTFAGRHTRKYKYVKSAITIPDATSGEKSNAAAKVHTELSEM